MLVTLEGIWKPLTQNPMLKMLWTVDAACASVIFINLLWLTRCT